MKINLEMWQPSERKWNWNRPENNKKMKEQKIISKQEEIIIEIN